MRKLNIPGVTLKPDLYENITVKLDNNSELNFHINSDVLSKSIILVQHPDKDTRIELRTRLESWGCLVFSAGNHAEALRIVNTYPIQIALISAPASDRPEFSIMRQFLKRSYRLQVLLIGDPDDLDGYEDAIALGAAGVTIRPIRAPELKAQLILMLRPRERLFSFQPTIPGSSANEISGDYTRLFSMTTQLHHVETAAHVQRIGRFSQLLAELIGCDSRYAQELGEAAVWHDIGKLAIPDAILKKPGPLTPEEFAIMKTHPVLGGQILSHCKAPMLRLAHAAALFHHERWDGSGYPARLRGDACPLEARIVGIVDVYDALTEERVYKKPWAREKVIEFLKSRRNIFFEGRLVDTLLDNLVRFEEVSGNNAHLLKVASR